MTKSGALYKCFTELFDGIPCYEENSVPENAIFPYLTYPIITGSFDGEIAYTVFLWDKSTSFKTLGDIVENLEKNFNNGTKIISFNDGTNQKIRIVQATPKSQGDTDPDDNTVKRKVLNFIIEFLTTY